MSTHHGTDGSIRHAPRVVVGVSESDSGRGALRYAVREASARKAALHVVRVWREIDGLFSMTAARAIGLRDRERADELVLAEAVEAARTLDPGVCVIPEFVPGDLYSAMQARTDGAGLLVLGVGDGEDNAFLIGDWFRQHAYCQVVLVAADGAIVHNRTQVHATRPFSGRGAPLNDARRLHDDRAGQTRD